MKGFARPLVLAAALVATMMLSAPQSYAKTVEQQLEELNQKLVELQETVKQQGRKIEQQQRVISDLEAQIVPSDMAAEEVARRVEPHLDKHLLHEQSGLGEQLGNLHTGVGLTGIVQGSTDAEDVSGEGNDQTDASWSLDLEIESPIGENGLGFVLIEAAQADGLTDELEAVFHGVNDDAGDSASGLDVTEAWYEHYFCGERVALTVGKLDLSNYVDGNAVANDETVQFLNSGLVNSLAIEFPEDNGPGVRVGVYLDSWVEFNFGWAESDADWEDIMDDSFGIAEMNFMPGFGGRNGNYRFYVWVNGSDKQELDGADEETGWGAGLSFDQNITDCLTAFVRAGFAEDDVYLIEGNWSAGVEIRGMKWDRENDVLGLAVSQALINDDVDPDDTETLFEAYYSIALNDQLFISPDIQIINNPGGNDHNDTVVVVGTRGQLNF